MPPAKEALLRLGPDLRYEAGPPKLDAAALPDAVGERDRHPIVGGFECFEARSAVVVPDQMGSVNRTGEALQ